MNFSSSSFSDLFVRLRIVGQSLPEGNSLSPRLSSLTLEKIFRRTFRFFSNGLQRYALFLNFQTFLHFFWYFLWIIRKKHTKTHFEWSKRGNAPVHRQGNNLHLTWLKSTEFALYKGTIYMFTLPPSLISWASLQIFRILWLWAAVCMTDGIPYDCINLVLPCPPLCQTHIRKNASNPVCVSVHNFRNPATVPYNAWSARMARHTYAKTPQILYVSQYCKSSLMADECVVCY